MIGSGELIVILCVILVLFGGKKLPEFARNLGLGIREFKKACNETEDCVEAPPAIQQKKKTDTLSTAKVEVIDDK